MLTQDSQTNIIASLLWLNWFQCACTAESQYARRETPRMLKMYFRPTNLILGCGKLIICFSVIFLWKSVRASEILFYFNFKFYFRRVHFWGVGLAPLCYFYIFLDIEHTMAQQALLRYMYTDEKLHVSPLSAKASY